MTSLPVALPIEAVFSDLEQALYAANQSILQAEPGAGKSTAVPLHLLSLPNLSGRIIMLEPRRLAAKNLAVYLASVIGEKVGERIGYRVRGEQRISNRTRLEIVTEGVLIRQLQEDPSLDGVSLLIFDEFHERNLQGDTALAFALESQSLFREDLHLLVMSATLDGIPLEPLMPAAQVIRCAGRQFPIDYHYMPVNRLQPLVPQWGRAIMQALQQQSGSVLVFLPGSREIRQVQEYLTPLLADLAPIHSVLLYPLSGQLDFADQERAIAPAPAGTRKVVLATNVAESSLTIDGITVVVDSGLERRGYFDSRTWTTRLETRQIAKSSAIQRAGRAGRLGPGVCYRLWTAEVQDRLEEQSPAEILRADLSNLVLDAAAWGTAPEALRWIDQPPAAALAQARQILQHLHALTDEQALTSAGHQIARLPVEPYWGHLLLIAQQHPLFKQDAQWRLQACLILAMHEQRGETIGELSTLLRQRNRSWQSSISRWWQFDVRGQSAQPSSQVMPDFSALTGDISLLLAVAWPDRIARHRGQHRYQLAGGQTVRMGDDHPLAGQEFVVVVSLMETAQGLQIQLAERLDLASTLSAVPALAENMDYMGWDAQEGRVRAERRRCIGALVLQQQPLTDLTAEQKSRCLLAGIRQQGIAVLPWQDNSRQLVERVRCAREWLPEESWPDWQDEALLASAEDWLLPALNGFSRLEQLKSLSLTDLLLTMLPWELRQVLERELPTHWEVPTGSQIRLHYEHGSVPVLSVRIQEMYGQQVTPLIAKGRIALQIELLSPALRPLQITQDLPAFWRGAYVEVKKEMKGRYPKHVWPDDPAQALPTRKTKKYS